MLKIEYLKMFELEDKHFWFVAKRYFIDSVLQNHKWKLNKILDLGCGTGGVTKFLQKYGNVVGIENYDYAIKLARSRGLNIVKADLNNFKVNQNSFDLVTILDVLYHQKIKNESEIIKKAYRSLKKGGLLLISDSALSILNSQHDIATEGRRRYSLPQMIRLVQKQNFKVVKSSYIYITLFPIVFIKRVLIDKIIKNTDSDVKPVPDWFNTILLNILKAEAGLLKYLSFPVGSSLIVLAIKK